MRALTRYAFLLALCLMFGAGLLAGPLGGPLRAAAADAERAAGRLAQKLAAHFVLREVYVNGRVRQDSDDLRAALGIAAGEPLWELDLAAAQQRLEALPWIARAQLSRRWPDMLYVQLTERIPSLLWQREQELVLLDKEGKVIPQQDPAEFAFLPTFFGGDAADHASSLIAQLQDYPALRHHVVGGRRLSARRWVLHMDHGGRMHLPAKSDEIAQSLNRFMALKGVREILATRGQDIDLRFFDRVLLRPSEPQRTPAPGAQDGEI